LLFFLFLSHSTNGQVIAGIRANGRIMVHGDTLRVCKGSSVTYQSAAQGSLVIDWRFTNGGTTTSASGLGPITINYNTNGFDTAFQKVTGGAFADSTFIIIAISDIKPVAGFNFSPDNVCGNENIQFTNTSSTGEPLSFLWNFGDASGSTAQHPTHQFLTAIGPPGTQQFPVKLVVTNVNGCRDSVTNPVTIRKVPDASIGNGDPLVTFGLFNGFATFKKCNNIPSYNFKFKNLSSTIALNTAYTIHWGDGSPDSVFNSWSAATIIGHNFPLGSSTMELRVTGPDGCIGIKKYLVFLGTIPAGGLASLGNTDICSSDSLRFLITNVDNNPPGTTYTFLINDGSQAQVFQHPPPSIVAHYFNVGSCFYSSNNGISTYQNAFGAYLTIENPCGSNSASVVPIYVSGKPRPAIYLPTPVVCVNTAVNIINNSSYGNVINSTGTFTSECINNGKKVWAISPSSGYTLLSGSLGSLNGNNINGSAWSDGTNSLNVLFTAVGTYTIRIYIYNDRCGIDSTERVICVRNPPQSSFTLGQHSSCGPIALTPTNTSPAGGCQGDDYDWQISYSDPKGCATASSPAYSFINGTSNTSTAPTIQLNKIGQYIIKLFVRAHNSPYGCPEVYSSDTFYIKGPPVASINGVGTICINNSISPAAIVNNCYAPGPFVYQWNFPGGNPASTTGDSPGPVLYGSAGTYPVQLIAIDSSCLLSDTVAINITVNPAPTAEAGNNNSVCSGTQVQLGIPGVSGVTYQWNPVTGLNNPSIANPILLTSYTGSGNDTTYTYYLTASAGSNCTSLDSVKITVKRMPALTVTPAAAEMCIGSNITITAAGAESYSWSPATGLNNVNTSTVIASPAATTTYTIIGSMSNGCFMSRSATVTVHPDADANFVAPDSVRCAPVNIDTIISNVAFPAGNSLYNWYANNQLIGTNTSGSVPSFTILQPGDTVMIKLVALSPFGCKPDSVQKTFITRPSVTALFTKDRDSSCAPLLVNFTNTSTLLTSNIAFSWDFGNGITSSAIQPGTITFNTSPAFRDTVYHVVLKAFNGCDTSYFRDSVKVFANSKARFAVDTTRGCSPFTIHIQNTSLGNNGNYYWDFGDGQADTTHSLSSLLHTYYTGVIRNYTIRLISENQCTRDTQSLVIVVNPITIQPFVTAYGSDQSGCAPHLVTFNNSSIGAAQLTWNFGDNSPPVIIPNNQNSITHLYTSPGNYTVTIRLQNDCSDTTILRSIVVYDPPLAAFSADPLRACPEQVVTVSNNSTNANSYEWDWGDGNTSSFANGQHVYSTAGNYTIMLVAKKVQPAGFVCYDTTYHAVSIVDRIPALITVNPAKPCAPYNLQVSAGNISGYSAVDWTIYDSSTAQGVFHLSGPSASHVFTVPGSYRVKLVVRTTSACADSVTYQFNVHPTPKAAIDPPLIKTCNHDTLVHFAATVTKQGNEQVNFSWLVNGSIAGNTNPFQHAFTTDLYNHTPIEYSIQSLATNQAGCGDTSLSARLIVQPLPWPHIAVSPSLVIQQPDYTFSFTDTAITNANKTYTWYMGDKTQQTKNGRDISYQYGDTGTYKVKLLVSDFSTGCRAYDSTFVTIQYIPGYLYVPNAICVGCSNYSLRQFLPLAKGLKTYRLRVYNSWGQKIFETDKLDSNGSPSEPWKATFNGQVLQQDVYSWQIEATYINGVEWKGMLFPGSGKPAKAGFITVIK
jgi:PKD repeat protein